MCIESHENYCYYPRMSTIVSQENPLGKVASYKTEYDSSLLFPLARFPKRDEIGITIPLPFFGYDIWNVFELSWLNSKGKPLVAVAEIVIPCDSPYLIESKSMKLYFNSLNNTKFDDVETVRQTIVEDLSNAAQARVSVSIQFENQQLEKKNHQFKGVCIDDLDVACETYMVDSALLSVGDEKVSESLYSNLLRSNCLITHQPDWGSVVIEYTGNKINREALLKYIVSFRNHNEFHEQCVERMFMDISQRCQPEKLLVYARYTRRGGLDINPIRSSEPREVPENHRLFRQ